MGKSVVFEYDRTGDILHIDRVRPYSAQEIEMLDDFVVARYNPKTGKLEGLEVLSFSQRLNGNKVLELPIDAFELGEAEASAR